jgi:hypothetical protein
MYDIFTAFVANNATVYIVFDFDENGFFAATAYGIFEGLYLSRSLQEK